MSNKQSPPAGWTWSHFRAVCADVGSWTWGTVQGAFNEKASLSQIIVDAIVGMIPLLGDATAVRDLIAVIMGMVDEEEKRNSTWQWVLLVVLLFALIPVLGGAIKGVGRLLIKAAEEAAHLAGAARLAHMGQAAKDIVAFLNRIGFKHAEKWLLSLRFSSYQAQIVSRCLDVIDTFSKALFKIKKSIGAALPGNLVQRIDAIQLQLGKIRTKASEMIPTAIKELDNKLREIQTFIRTGGETTSRVATREIATGKRAVTRADEARVIENEVPPVRTRRGGLKQNPARADNPDAWKKYYKKPPKGSGYPDLTEWDSNGVFKDLQAFSGKVSNRPLREGERIFRFFGPEGLTRGEPVGAASAKGRWWGIGPAPRTAKEWRQQAAVLDEFNRDGFVIEGIVRAKTGPKAAVGKVSEQMSSKIPGQYLPGGATQAVMDMHALTRDKLASLAEQVMKTKKPAHYLDPASGIEFTIRPTGWTDANGVWGYVESAHSLQTTVSRLGARERAPKTNDGKPLPSR
ncbi:hypothetical protein HBDW_13600 [Herbaspirillum sp. DW155]|uniref:hypothetical protein n=1 Tax=Herbaspirillum sp. DW155 TaxID=3095609 RepID=UPI00308668D0|nr:hypothetical protein HBDW_13600 [Herbaspirillum sp. DW155]